MPIESAYPGYGELVVNILSVVLFHSNHHVQRCYTCLYFEGLECNLWWARKVGTPDCFARGGRPEAGFLGRQIHDLVPGASRGDIVAGENRANFGLENFQAG